MTKQPINQLVDHFFRNEFGKVVTLLTSRFGTHHLEMAEDAVQEALTKAMQVWAFGKIPDNPSGWIIRVAQNKLIDHLRKQQKVFYATQLPENSYTQEEPSQDQFKDEMIKMMFACCNPRLSKDYQLILTLKILGGLSIREIAAALLKKEETIAKSYTRAKKQFKKENLKLELPSNELMQDRLQMVLKTIYLLFNEGYKSSEGQSLIRRDLCEEAMRLNYLLLEKQETNNDWSRSLMALMHLQVSRFDSRIDQNGQQVSLEFQDRTKWHQGHISQGNRYLSSIQQGLQNPYFIQAAISGIHSATPNWKDTNWPVILTLYNHLYSINQNPIVRLNSLYPFAKVHGPLSALSELELIKNEPSITGNYLVPATEAELFYQLNRNDEALGKLKEAIELANNQLDKEFLQSKHDAIKKAMT